MSSDWKRLKLGDLVTLNYGKSLTASKRTEGSIPVYSSAGITGSHNQALVNSKGIILGRKGSIGTVYKSNRPFFPIDTVYYILPNDKEYDFNYLYYLLSNLGLENLNQDSAVPGLNRNAAYAQEILLPPLKIQKKIACIVTTLDDKIELNKKINQTLESIAQTIFKSWFVDFDPVHAKANANSEDEYDAIAKELGISREILDLFPSEFEESELGLIPKGWNIKKLGDCELEIESGKRPKGGIDKSLKFGVPSIGAESIQSPIGTFDYSNVKYVSRDFSSTARRGWGKNFDVMLYKDGGKPGLFKPRVSLYGEDFPFKEFMINEHVFILRSSLLGQFYLFYLVSSDSILEQLIAKGSSKAAQPGLNQDEVKNSLLVLPSLDVISAYNTIVKDLVKLQLNKGKENSSLTKIRDALLPKLLSGEIDVSCLNLEPEHD
ncbi:TPA: restriction endonuclease subunit S [Legionella pneumophila]|uniref:restriction endonuclease subunit S n=1 Tax=Legionella pneumophila TaxID=446 RepID=UPI00067E7BC3|nr:restriction endonuclease subunit S [Legionella pneumophila]SNV20209.1 type I restriction-modification system (methylase_S) [Legionella pneumophila]HAT8692469.1 restriction endonuclease subunit S [Legionella pneumophila]HAU1215316.1 restriction endonuclease subunit S [Legionella pneumophila]